MHNRFSEWQLFPRTFSFERFYRLNFIKADLYVMTQANPFWKPNQNVHDYLIRTGFQQLNLLLMQSQHRRVYHTKVDGHKNFCGRAIFLMNGTKIESNDKSRQIEVFNHRLVYAFHMHLPLPLNFDYLFHSSNNTKKKSQKKNNSNWFRHFPSQNLCNFKHISLFFSSFDRKMPWMWK